MDIFQFFFLKKILSKLIIILKLFSITLLLILKIIIRLKYDSRFDQKVLLCTVAKDENKYIKEFMEHYKKLKISKIIIYDNNDINGEYIQEIIKNDIENNYVKIINYRGFKQPQKVALDDCYKRYNYNYDWIAFYDIDEFLHIKNYSNIKDFLSLPKLKNCQGILINWKYYGDNNKLYYEPKPLAERFIQPFYFLNSSLEYIKYFISASKTIVRGRLKIIWGHFPHYIKNIINCRPDGKLLYNYLSPPQYSIAYINHYITKSTEEFAERLNRGDVILKVDEFYIKSRINDYYFLFNNKTKKKVDLFKERLKYKIQF